MVAIPFSSMRPFSNETGERSYMLELPSGKLIQIEDAHLADLVSRHRVNVIDRSTDTESYAPLRPGPIWGGQWCNGTQPEGSSRQWDFSQLIRKHGRKL